MDRVPANHAYVTGGDDICFRLMQGVMQAAALVQTSAAEQSDELLERMRSSARADNKWSELAPDIESWETPEGNVGYGVHPSNPRYDQAIRLEYGDTTQAPIPLVRMGLLSNVADMGWSMTQRFREAGF